jgi:hypothetical protein
MSTTGQVPAPTTDPDSDRAEEDVPPALGRVLSLVRKLIDYGKQLAATVQQHASAADFALFARPFGTSDLATILARIAAGLCRAAMLEARLCQRAARGQDLTMRPIRMPAIRVPGVAQQVGPPATRSDPECTNPAEDPRLARLPTEAEIVAELRRRPVGAVIVDICRDLGIAPGHLDRAFWDEIRHAIIAYGGSLAGFFSNLHRRLFAFALGEQAGRADPGWPAVLPQSPAAATGPP